MVNANACMTPRTSCHIVREEDLRDEVNRLNQNGWYISSVRRDVDRVHHIALQAVYVGCKIKDMNQSKIKIYDDKER